MNKIIVGLLIVCLLGISYLIYYQQVYYPKKLLKCYTIAVGLERQRHINDVDPTDINDVSEYSKNMDSCLGYELQY